MMLMKLINIIETKIAKQKAKNDAVANFTGIDQKACNTCPTSQEQIMQAREDWA